MNSRLPRFNLSGQVASGAGTLWLDGKQFGVGWGPCPWSNSHWFFKGVSGAADNRPFIVPSTGGTPQAVPDPTGKRYDYLSAGSGQWMGTDPSQGIVDIWVGRDGKKAWIVEHNGSNDDHSVFFQGAFIARGSYHHVRTEDGLLVVTKKTPGRPGTGEIWGLRPGGVFESLRVFTHSFEFTPVPIMTSEGPWVGFITNFDIRIHPWKSAQGFLIKTGEDKNREWDMVWFDHRIRVAWENGGTSLGTHSFGLADQKVDTSAPWATTPQPKPVCDNEYQAGETGNCPRCGNPKSKHKIKETPVAKKMTLPRPIYDTWKKVADKFHDMHKSSNDRDRAEATKRGVQTIRARHKGTGELDGSRYVCKSEHNTGWAAASKDAPGFVPEGPVVHGRLTEMHMFDMINGTSRETNAYPVTSHNFEPGEKFNPEAYVLIPEEHDWLEDGEPQEPTEPEKHRYDGGDNDTGTCDICGKPREDSIHIDDEEPTEPEPGEVAQLRVEVAALKAQVGSTQIIANQLMDRVAALESRPAPQPSEGITEARLHDILHNQWRAEGSVAGFLSANLPLRPVKKG